MLYVLDGALTLQQKIGYLIKVYSNARRQLCTEYTKKNENQAPFGTRLLRFLLWCRKKIYSHEPEPREEI